MAAGTARITSKYRLKAFMTVAAISFVAAESDRKPALPVTGAAGIDFRGKLVFIVLNSLFWDFY
jgi:hypothetical protein